MCKMQCWRWVFGNKIPISLWGRVGISMMTILEAMEWLVVAAAAGLCFVGCCASRRSGSGFRVQGSGGLRGRGLEEGLRLMDDEWLQGLR